MDGYSPFRATRRAIETPLTVARVAAATLGRLQALVRIGNVNARSDAATAAQMAFAALKGAQYNVVINTGSLQDSEFARGCREEVGTLVNGAEASLHSIDSMMLA